MRLLLVDAVAAAVAVALRADRHAIIRRRSGRRFALVPLNNLVRVVVVRRLIRRQQLPQRRRLLDVVDAALVPRERLAD